MLTVGSTRCTMERALCETWWFWRPESARDRRELDGLVCDGLARRAALDVWVAADLPDSPALRRRVTQVAVGHARVRRLLGRGAAFGGITAAWLLGAPAPAPVRLHLLTPGVHGGGRPAWLQPHEVPLDPRDVVHLDDLPCTSPARTVIDVLRDPASMTDAETDDPDVLATTLGALYDLRRSDLEEVASRMRSTRGLPAARRWVARNLP